jgi:hypothetical protein
MTLDDMNLDSRIDQIEFKNGYLVFYWEDYFKDKIFEIRIKTDSVYINYKLEEIAYEFCQIRKFNLIDYLPVDEKSKLYMMPPTFIAQMKAVRQKFHLAAGLNSIEWKHFIQVYGDGVILACPLKSYDNVDIEDIGTMININPN